MGSNFNGNNKKKLFIIGSLFILSIFLVFLIFFQDLFYKPSTCLCAKIFSMDSTVSLPAAKRLVGSGHYIYTIQTARKNCLQFYQKDINEWQIQQHVKGVGFIEDSSFFVSKCLQK
jgi:hypothetical protein